MKPRSCNGCSAFIYDGLSSRCGLKHKIIDIKTIKSIYGEIFVFAPIEECEKPKSIREFCELSLRK